MHRPSLLALTAALTSCLMFIAAPVLACGGFFCSQVPVEQRGEQIVFTYGPGDKVTAIIQIAYQGSAEDFAWVVPVTGQPTIALGPDAIFSTLRMRTDPSFYLNWQTNGDNSDCGMWAVPEMASAGGIDDGGNEVVVLDKQLVGPFIAVTLDATEAGAEVLLQWLDDNDFDQPEESLPLIDHYLGLDMNFIAVKLQENATTGDLQPLMLTMEGTGPCIPLVLTRIAAAPDMPVTAWVFGETRVVPTNWFDVTINPKKIDWISGGGNYEEAATAAIDEAAGHGFITEYAMNMWTEALLWQEGQYDTEALAQITDPSQFLDTLLMQGFPRNAQMQSLIQQFIPKPDEAELSDECKTDQQFYTWNIDDCLNEMPADWVFDAAGFAAALEEKVVQPMKSGQEVLDRVANEDTNGDQIADSSYLTRLFSTVSPEEMTRDPMFAFNRDLGDVSNWHEATAVAVCDEVNPNTVASATITYEGMTWTVEGPFEELWNVSADDFVDPAPEESASGQIMVYSMEGQGQIISLEDVAQQEQTFELMDPTHLPFDGEIPDRNPPTDTTPTDTTPTTTTPTSNDGGGCGVGGGAGSAALIGGLLIGLGVLTRRRRDEV